MNMQMIISIGNTGRGCVVQAGLIQGQGCEYAAAELHSCTGVCGSAFLFLFLFLPFNFNFHFYIFHGEKAAGHRTLRASCPTYFSRVQMDLFFPAEGTSEGILVHPMCDLLCSVFLSACSSSLGQNLPPGSILFILFLLLSHLNSPPLHTKTPERPDGSNKVMKPR